MNMPQSTAKPVWLQGVPVLIVLLVMGWVFGKTIWLGVTGLLTPEPFDEDAVTTLTKPSLQSVDETLPCIIYCDPPYTSHQAPVTTKKSLKIMVPATTLDEQPCLIYCNPPYGGQSLPETTKESPLLKSPDLAADQLPCLIYCNPPY